MFLLYSQWLQLPIGTRHTIAYAFKINKKNPTHVIDNEVRDDGYPIGDVERALTMDAMREYVGTASNSIDLVWSALVAKAEGRDFVVSQTVAPESMVIPETKVETSPAHVDTKSKSPAKNIKKGK